jgi:S1-C subfamily serine protease
MMRTFTLGFLLAAAACGPRPLPAMPSDQDDPNAAARVDPGTPSEVAAPTPPPTATSKGAIAHADLLVVLDAGPAAFLGKVKPEPTFAGGRFAGWRIGAVPRGAGGFGSVDLSAGDIVLKVNGQSVERPEAFQELWDAMRFADHLTVEIDREGAAHVLDFAIVKSAADPVPPAEKPAPPKK